MSESLYERFAAALPGVTILPEEPLSKHTSFRIGGPASLFVMPETQEEILEILGVLRARVQDDLKP